MSARDILDYRDRLPMRNFLANIFRLFHVSKTLFQNGFFEIV